ncbi:transposase [Geomicrobium sp. JCM 19039]|uniref:transposase n=1 Tax=Geomicrobium sp. JCM 19039 TaxID=1460636 RepID=UPI000A5A89B0|nr:transposase [Geomicrobium sp. JCM 19039]
MVVIDISPSFKSSVNQALGRPIIIANRFHFCRYIYWALDQVRRRVQKTFHEYDRKKCKQMRHVFHKRAEKLSEKQTWYLNRYLELSEELREVYGLKNQFQAWFDKHRTGKTEGTNVFAGLQAFYQAVETSALKVMKKAAKNIEELATRNSQQLYFGHTKGPIERLNNQTKVIKRNAFGFCRYDRLHLKMLLHHQLKEHTSRVG